MRVRPGQEEKRKGKELRYGADWAECPTKNSIDKLSPKGTNTSKACYGHECVQRWTEIPIKPLGGAEEEIVEEGFGEEMTERGLL